MSTANDKRRRARGRPFLTVLIGLAVAVLVASASASVDRSRPAVRSDLCTLRVNKQLLAVGVQGICRWSKSRFGGTPHVSAYWGTAETGLGLTVYTGIRESRFRSKYGVRNGSAVRVGSFAREESTTSETLLTAWVRGVGLFVEARHVGTPGASKAYDARVVVLARAAANQV